MPLVDRVLGARERLQRALAHPQPDAATVAGDPMVSRLRERGGWLAAIALIVALVTWTKALAIWYPVAFGDESTYSLLAKFGASEQVVRRVGLLDLIPNHLFFGVYQLVYSFGDNFLAGAKLVNSLFIGAAFVPIYLLCRIFLSYGKSIALAMIAVLGPFSSYATYFMPESMYFFGFWLYAYVSIRLVDRPVILQAIVAGALLGLQVIIKPHALILLPCSALLYALVVLRKIDPTSTIPRLVAAWAVLLATFAAVRIVAVYLITGQLELSFTGPTYSTMVTDSSRIGDTLARLPGYLSQLRGHAAFLILLYLAPLAIVVLFMAHRVLPKRSPQHATADPRLTGLLFFAATILLLLVAVTVKFSFDIVFADAYQVPTRVHGRYYSFALPLIPICATIVLDRYHDALSLHGRWAWTAALAAGLAVLIYVAHAMLGSFEQAFSIVDFPDAFFLAGRPMRYAAMLAAVAVTAFLLHRSRPPAVTFLVYWAILTALATIAVQQWAIYGVVARNEDRFGVAVRNLLGEDERNAGMIVASTYGDARIFRVMFHLNSLSRAVVVPVDGLLGEGQIDDDRKWLLLLDNYRVVVPGQTIIKGDGFELIRLSPRR